MSVDERPAVNPSRLWTAPPPMSDGMARWLRSPRERLLTEESIGPVVLQTGGAVLEYRLRPAPGGPEPEVGPEPRIETFVVDETGACTPTGTDRELIDAVLPAATSMVAAVLEAMTRHRVELQAPGYLSASLTEADAVTTVPHFDDDQYLEGDGVGLVAIAATHDGPRIACEPIVHRPARQGLPLEVEDQVLERFASGRIRHHRAPAERIVVFPQFGQLHSGPILDPASDRGIRTLLVFRAGTVAEPGS